METQQQNKETGLLLATLTIAYLFVCTHVLYACVHVCASTVVSAYVCGGQRTNLAVIPQILINFV